ncbi:Protein of unknown function, partial [Gryllus bimaculatus]
MVTWFLEKSPIDQDVLRFGCAPSTRMSGNSHPRLRLRLRLRLRPGLRLGLRLHFRLPLQFQTSALAPHRERLPNTERPPQIVFQQRSTPGRGENFNAVTPERSTPSTERAFSGERQRQPCRFG